MAKNIIICSDGTGNTAIKGRGTNVFRMFEAVDLNGHRADPKLRPQVAIYDDGVGTEDFKPLKIVAGATGYGLSRNVKQLYKELVRIHDPQDRIYLFGFSRGAFTVRTLAGLIGNCGILKTVGLDAEALDKKVEETYRVYRRRYRTVLSRFLRNLFRKKTDPDPDQAAIESFRKENCHPDPHIAFVGVWDTVDAVGLPFHLSDFINLTIYRFKFPDRSLGLCVDRACHAIAIDDERHSFHPLLWQENEGTRGRLEQVWFAGAHSNVGGGYPKQGMSLVALDWMMEQAERAELRLLKSDREYYREHANVDDKLYDSRAGLGIFYRWKPRDISAMCGEYRMVPKIHLSVLERVAHGTDDYAPGNLPSDLEVVITGNPEKDILAKMRADAVCEVYSKSRGGRGSLASEVPHATAAGRLSYYIYLLTLLAALAFVFSDMDFRKSTELSDLVSMNSAALWMALKALIKTPETLLYLAGGFLLSYALAELSDGRMSAKFSRFWHEHQQQLRSALKAVRQEAQARNIQAPQPMK